ncbi:retrovirus-related pol polyprotein from transposon TNT 1-94 [Tanacetum coccineum]
MSMLVKDTRSQDGKDDKDNDKGSKSRSRGMKEQAYNEDKDQEHSSLNDKSNLTDLMKESKSANPLALIAAAQPYSDNYYQAPKPQRSNATSSSTRQSASTRHKGKEVAKPITPQSESVSEEDSDPEQAQRDKEMQKNLALLAKYFKKLYKPTNNNLRTSSNSKNKTEDTTPRYNNDNQSRQFRNQRTMTVAGARETVGSQVVQQIGIQCFNCKGYGHYAKECRKPKRQADWLEDTDEEIDEQELEAHYSYMAKIQEVSPEESSSTGQPLEQVQNHDESNVYDNVRRHSEQPESINDTYVLEKDDSNVTPDSSNICTNDNQVDQNAAECVDERAALANLIANLTLDTEENKTILKQLKKANASLTQELEKCKTNLDETNSALGEAISCRDSCLIALQNKQNEFEKYKAFNDRTIDYEILQTKLNETLGLLALKDIEIKEGLKTKAYEISVLDQKHDDLVKKSLLTKSQLEGYLKENTKVISDLKVKEDKRYSQWRSRFLRYIDTKNNGEGLKKCILNGPYVPTSVLIQAVPAAEGRPAVQQHTAIETVLNMTPENKEHFQSEKEAIFLLLTGIGDEIYSTVDACNTANEMWIAIERLQQGESLNVQDVKTNLFWEFGKFTSRDGESMESYYSRFYKLMNELTRNNLQVTTMQVNVQFLQQLQPEWSRFVTLVKQSEKIDTISYHRLFDILKQFQKEVNDIRAERIAKSANPLALLAAAQPYSDTYYQAPKPQRSNATSSSTRQSASTRHKGKEVAKPITPQSESVSEEDSDPEQAQRDKEMQKNLALLAKYFKKLYKPTNNNLRTSSNSRNKTEDTTPRYNNDNQSRQFGNQRTMTVAGARETVGSQVVQQTGIQCFNCKGYGHYAKECRKPKRVKDYAYHKEKMMMCKQAEQGVPLQAEQADWLEDTDEEIDEQELEAHYSYIAKIQEVSPEESSSTGQPLEQVQNHDESNVYESINDTYVLKKDDSNVTPDSSNICTNDNQVDQNAAECVDERAALANLTLDTEENKTILKQLKKANASLTQELEKCKTNLDTNLMKLIGLWGRISCRDSCLIALQNKQNEFDKYKAFNDRTIDYEILQTKLNETLGLLTLKDIEIKEVKGCDVMQTACRENKLESVNNEVHNKLLKCLLNLKNNSISLELSFNIVKKDKKQPSLQRNMASNCISKRREQYMEIQDLKLKCKKRTVVINELKKLHSVTKKESLWNTQFDKPLFFEQPYAQRIPNPSVVGKTDSIFQILLKFKKKEVEDHHRISNISKKTKSVTACNDSSNSRTSNVNAVCAECGKCVCNSNHDACVSRYLKDVNARTKKPKIVQLILFIVDSGCTKHMTGNLKLLCNFVEKFLGTVRFRNDQFAPILETTSSTPICFMAKASPTQACKAKMFIKSKVVPSSKGRLNLLHMDLCGPMRVASINGKKYILVIVDDYSRYTWTLFLRSKDETPEVLKDFLTMIQRNLQAQTSTPRTPEQNGVVERRNRTLVEAARTMLLASKLPLSFWAEAVATACYTQNRSIFLYDSLKDGVSNLKDRRRFYVAQQERVSCSRSSKKSSTLRKALLDLKSSKALQGQTQKHLKEVKRIFRYLKGTINMGLWYPKDSGFELTAFSDVDHVGCIDTRKSTLGGYSALGDMPSKLDVKKQNACNVFKQRQSYVALSASCAQVNVD